MVAWYWASKAKMRGVGPAGRWLNASKVRGRRMVVRRGGSRSVGGRMVARKDCFCVRVVEEGSCGGG